MLVSKKRKKIEKGFLLLQRWNLPLYRIVSTGESNSPIPMENAIFNRVNLIRKYSLQLCHFYLQILGY